MSKTIPLGEFNIIENQTAFPYSTSELNGIRLAAKTAN